MKLAEQRILARAPESLSPQRLQEMKEASGKTLFVAGNYPSVTWRAVLGFEPDPKRHYEVIVGIAVAPGCSPNLIARAYVSRDPADDLCHIEWDPQS